VKAVVIRHGHLYCGLGGGKKGFNRAGVRIGNVRTVSRCVGGIDCDPRAIAKFDRMGPGRKGTVMDLFSRGQYIAFHGHEPPPGWREAMPADVRAAFGNEHVDVGFLSAPCKGFSGLLSEAKSASPKYQALNELTLRGIWLFLEAYKDDPAECVLFENVPRIATRGRPLLDQIVALLQAYGYAVRETAHDCGEIGGLAQTRKRFLLIARHVERVPPFIYEPVKRPLRAVGEVLGQMPHAGNEQGGPMHRVPALQWKTWVRLAFVEAGKDWRSLQRLRVADGVLQDFGLVPLREYHRNTLGVTKYDEPASTITSNGRPASGKFSVADPTIKQSADYGQLGVRDWHKSTGTVSGQSTVGGGAHAIADPRVGNVRFNSAFKVVAWDANSPAIAGPGGAGAAVADPNGYGESTHHHVLRVTPWSHHGGTITASRAPGGGALCVADPRSDTGFRGKGKYIVTGYEDPCNTVIAASTTGNGAYAVADPTIGARDWRSGPYGVLPWTAPATTVAGSASPDNSFSSVADPRLPEADERLVCVIQSTDGTWHRPFTTLELAALQSLLDPGELFNVDAKRERELAAFDRSLFASMMADSDSGWREHIGNAVPPDAAEAMANVIFRALLAAKLGQTFSIGMTPRWVRPVAVALAVDAP
jgi:site-specific DNA-cytosine methylase